jgi:hypothetical protein
MKTIKNILIIFGIIFLILFVFAKGIMLFLRYNVAVGYDVQFTNLSQDSVCVLVLEDDNIPFISPYAVYKNKRDTLYKIQMDTTNSYVHGLNVIKPDTTKGLSLGRKLSYQWEKLAESSKDHKIRFLVFKTSTILNNSWRDIKMKNIYDKRYALSMDSLEKMNWTITYP